MKRPLRVIVFVIAIGLVTAFPLAVNPVSAHTPVTVGEYHLLVGWRDEPAVAGYLNGLDLKISNGTGAPVLGAEDTLNTTLSTGPASIAKLLEPQFGRDGWYTFDVVPTRVGTYTVRLTGTLGSTSVDVLVDLDTVMPASDFAFPVADPLASELQSRLDAANTAIVGLQLQLTLALAIALLGIVVGGVGLAMGLRLSRGQRKTP